MSKLRYDDWMTPDEVGVIAKLTQDSDYEGHNHDFFEIFYIVEGSVEHQLNGKPERLEIGDMFLLKKTDFHKFIRRQGNNCIHRDIIIRDDFFFQACNYLDDGLYEKISKTNEKQHIKLSKSKVEEVESFITDMNFASLTSEEWSKVSRSKLLVIKLLECFLQNIYPRKTNCPEWLKNILYKFNLSECVREGLPAILKDTSYDKSYVCRMFKKYVGCSMSQYLLKERLEIAASLLRTSGKTIASICEYIGIESIPYFTVSFAKKYGVSPSGFRKNGANKV